MIAGIIHEKPTSRWAFLFLLTFNHPIQSIKTTLAPVKSLSTNALSGYRRAGRFTILLLIINVVSDGFAGRPVGIVHQLLLLPISVGFFYVFWRWLQPGTRLAELPTRSWSPTVAITIAIVLQCASTVAYFFEVRHYAALGYRGYPVIASVAFVCVIVCLAWFGFGMRGSGLGLFLSSLSCYLVAMTLAITSFPLTYLRSDMLPVILWADTNLVHHISPYTTMFVGGRVYDFPYLPGMLLVYLPAVALHMDLRLISVASVALIAVLIFTAAQKDRRLEVASLLALFLTCPYLQYRHEIYSQPHWLTLVIVFVLMQRRKFLSAAAVFGLSMAIYQFSWIIFPFFLLNAWRRSGWKEVAKLTFAATVGVLVFVGPFLSSAYSRIVSNTVGQWGLRAHADAAPINLSYWVTYVLRPNQLLRLQAVVLIGIFAYCVITNACATLADTLRWMVGSLTIFILLNVLVDGYFYLMLLVPMLVYTCVANGWWKEFDALPHAQQKPTSSLQPAV